MGMMGKTLMFALAIVLGSPAAAGASGTFTLGSPAFRAGAPLSVATSTAAAWAAVAATWRRA